MGIKEQTINKIPSNNLPNVKITLVLKNLNEFIKGCGNTNRL